MHFMNRLHKMLIFFCLSLPCLLFAVYFVFSSIVLSLTIFDLRYDFILLHGHMKCKFDFDFL